MLPFVLKLLMHYCRMSPSQITKLQAAVKYGEEDLPAAKVSILYCTCTVLVKYCNMSNGTLWSGLTENPVCL